MRMSPSSFAPAVFFACALAAGPSAAQDALHVGGTSDEIEVAVGARRIDLHVSDAELADDAIAVLRAGAARHIALARFFAGNLAVQASGLERAVTALAE